MIRIACLGDSHLPAIKLGWDDIGPAHPDIAITFFGAPQARLLQVTPQDRALLPGNESLRDLMLLTASRDRIAVDDYDLFVITAMDITIRRLVFALANHRPFRFRGIPAPHLVSDVVYDQMLARLYPGALALQMATLIRGLEPAAKILLVPQPMPSELVVTTPDRGAGDEPFWAAIAAQGYQQSLAGDFDFVLDTLSLQYAVIRQPAETLAAPCFTRHEFSAGSIRMTGDFGTAHPDSDFIHMNRLYGARLLPHILAKARALQEPR